MHRTLQILGLQMLGWGFALALLVGVGLVQVIRADAAGKPHGRIELTAVPSRSVYALPPDGRKGNLELLRWSLRDRHGRTVGLLHASCRWHQDNDRLCFGEITLPRGSVIIAGSSTTRAFGQWAVLGGTDAYETAAGQLTFRATGLRKLTVTVTV